MPLEHLPPSRCAGNEVEIVTRQVPVFRIDRVLGTPRSGNSVGFWGEAVVSRFMTFLLDVCNLLHQCSQNKETREPPDTTSV